MGNCNIKTDFDVDNITGKILIWNYFYHSSSIFNNVINLFNISNKL
jgi:hypothetical protein